MSDELADQTFGTWSRGGQTLSRRGAAKLLGTGALLMLGPGCSAPDRGEPVPADRSTRATVLGLPNERFFPATDIGPLEQEFMAAGERKLHGRSRGVTRNLSPMNFLAISGGGEDGAFGAGLLCGWTEQGSRPEFDLVTGVSTGALTAPFAFLGPTYDEKLKAVYTGIGPKDILEERGIVTALFEDALADNAPLFKLISRYLNTEMLADIATAYDQGRLLLIASTDLDAQQPVIWNIGAMAKSGHPKAAETIRKVLLASAAVPAAFPPMMIDVTVDGKPYQEMHVDGGAITQVFLYPATVARSRLQRLRRHEAVFPITAYIIRNGRLSPKWSSVKRSVFNIAGRAISTMIAAGGIFDVIRIYQNTQRDDVGFNLASIPPEFTEETPGPFDQTYMRHLFDYSFSHARAGYRWEKAPPQLDETRKPMARGG